jgi:DNA-binding MarR family transcriptional regulator
MGLADPAGGRAAVRLSGIAHNQLMPGKVATPSARTDVIEALLIASRAMVAIASRSLADIDQDVTLTQSRALVLLASRGPQRVIDIAGDLNVAPSTATRMCDRLVRKGLLRRYRNAADRREVKVTLTATGRDLVRDVSRHRRDELARVVDALPAPTHAHVAAALQALNAAAGEPPDRDWWLGPDEPEDEPSR